MLFQENQFCWTLIKWVVSGFQLQIISNKSFQIFCLHTVKTSIEYYNIQNDKCFLIWCYLSFISSASSFIVCEKHLLLLEIKRISFILLLKSLKPLRMWFRTPREIDICSHLINFFDGQWYYIALGSCVRETRYTVNH